MIVTIQKPEYLPGLAYFDKIYKADICILLDSIPLTERDSCARTTVLGHIGPELIIVSVKRSQKSGQLIKDARIEDAIFWKKKHLKTLYHVYRNALYFEETYPALREIISRSWSSLADMNIELITAIASVLQLSCRFYRSSELSNEPCRFNNPGTPEPPHASEYTAELIKAVKGNAYLADESERPCLSKERFTPKHPEISVTFPDSSHPEYPQPQIPGDTFIPGLSIVDALFNCGKQAVHSFFVPIGVE